LSADRSTSAAPVWAALLLTAAIAAARDNDIGAPSDYLRRAGQAADHIHADRNDLWTSFGPTNVAIHGISVAVELGDVSETIRRAEQVNTTALPADLLERRAQVFIDLGRAYVQRRDDAAATTVFRQAGRRTRPRRGALQCSRPRGPSRDAQAGTPLCNPRTSPARAANRHYLLMNRDYER
jgi:hypothetical protein